MKAAFSSRPLPLSEGGLAGTAPTSSTKLGRQAAQHWGTIVILLLPVTILYVLFVLVPLAQAAFFSFFRWNGLGPLDTFVGFDNYVRALNDPARRCADSDDAATPGTRGGTVGFCRYVHARDGQTVLRDIDGVTEIAVWVTGANMNVALNGAKEVVGLRLIPLRSEAIDTVTLNGAQLQRQDVIVWDAISPSAWTIGQTARL